MNNSTSSSDPSRSNSNTSAGKSSLWPFWKLLLVNLAAMALIAIFVGWLALIWLDKWTDHGHFEVVPEVKGLQYSAAVKQLVDNGFTPELSDSIYDTKTRPGTVIDQNPKVGTKVKEGRVVYLTITAFSPKMVTVPSLNDVSLRQARSVLEGLGIQRINVVYVPSDFKDLVLGVTHEGRTLTPGARIPVNSQVTIEVGSGYNEHTDSLEAALALGALSDFDSHESE